MAATLTATTTPAQGKATVTLTWTDPTPDPTTALVERVHANGERLPVRGGDPAALAAGAWVGDDFEVPHDEQFYYVATSTQVPGVTITSPTYTVASSGATWLKHPGRPALNTVVQVTTPPDLTRPIEQGVFNVLGRARPVALSMRRQSEQGELRLFTATDGARSQLVGMLADGMPLLLVCPAGYGIGTVYISVAEVQEQRPSPWGKEQARLWSLPFTVVDRPLGSALAAGNSWTDVLGRYPSWSQMLQTEGTWADVLEGVNP